MILHNLIWTLTLFNFLIDLAKQLSNDYLLFCTNNLHSVENFSALLLSYIRRVRQSRRRKYTYSFKFSRQYFNMILYVPGGYLILKVPTNCIINEYKKVLDGYIPTRYRSVWSVKYSGGMSGVYTSHWDVLRFRRTVGSLGWRQIYFSFNADSCTFSNAAVPNPT